MAASRPLLGRLSAFGLVTIVFAVTQPVTLVAVPLSLLLVAFGPRDPRAAVIIGATLAASLLGDRMGLWWFERGWPLVLGGAFVCMVGWRPAWGFSAQVLAALVLAALVVLVSFALEPAAWTGIDALITERARSAAATASGLLGSRAEAAIGSTLDRVVSLQVAIFPALLAVSSVGALGVAVTVRAWLTGELSRAFGRLRSFRFNDHLVWLWLLGLALIVAPVGEIGDRVGGNFVFFMGALYVVRGLAVLISLLGGISVTASVVGGVIVVLVYPLLALLLAVMLMVGLGDTWLNIRARVRGRPDGGRDGQTRS